MNRPNSSSGSAGGWMDLTRAPMIDVHTTGMPEDGRWLALIRIHHLVRDDTTTGALLDELRTILSNQGGSVA